MMNWWDPSVGDTASDHFNMGDWSAFGISQPGSFMPNRAQFTTLNQVAGIENNPASPNFGKPRLSAYGTAGNATYNFADPYGRFGAGGAGGSGGGGGTASGGGGLQPQAIQPVQVNGQLAGANLGVGGGSLAPNAAPLIGGSSPLAGANLAVAGGGSAGAAAAPVITGSSGAGGAAGWFKTLMGNQRLISGVVSAAGTLYGQYDQKKQASKTYDAAMKELEARRAYEQQRIEAYQNSPAARMAPTLMKLVADIYGKRLNKHGVQFDTAAFLQQMFGGG